MVVQYENIEVIGKEIEILKTKLLLFMAISGGSWVYALKFSGVVFTVALFFVFVVSGFGVFSNLLKLSDVQKELQGLQNG